MPKMREGETRPGALLVAKRWAKATKAERQAVVRMLVEARRAKRRAKAKGKAK